MSRYDSMRKTRRNQAILEYHIRHPELSLAEKAKVFGITRQRFSQIIKKGDKNG